MCPMLEDGQARNASRPVRTWGSVPLAIASDVAHRTFRVAACLPWTLPEAVGSPSTGSGLLARPAAVPGVR